MRQELLERLLDIARQLAEVRNSTPLLNYAMEVALELFDAEFGYLILRDRDGMLDFRVRLARDNRTIPPPDQQISQTILTRVIEHREDLLLANALDNPDFDPTDSVIQLQIRSVICVPLITRERVLGALYLENRSTDGAFSEDVITPIKLFASQVAVSMENALLIDELESRVVSRTAALEKANTELEQLVADLNSFVHTVAHDLKTPLGALAGYADTLEKFSGHIDQEEQRHYANAIVRSVFKINDIIDALLMLASVRDMTEVPVVRVNMDEVVQGAIAQLPHLVERYQVEFVLPDLWLPAMGYGPWLEEAWVNYIGNAIKYGGRPARVEIGADSAGEGMVRYWVRDNGKGLTKADQQRVFQPFTRLGQANISGHGLGLPIVRRIIERLGGQVGVYSTPGEGSEFYFTLPSRPGVKALR